MGAILSIPGHHLNPALHRRSTRWEFQLRWRRLSPSRLLLQSRQSRRASSRLLLQSGQSTRASSQIPLQSSSRRHPSLNSDHHPSPRNRFGNTSAEPFQLGTQRLLRHHRGRGRRSVRRELSKSSVVLPRRFSKRLEISLACTSETLLHGSASDAGTPARKSPLRILRDIEGEPKCL